MGLKPITVSRLNAYIKRLLQTDPILGNISVIGEISNLKFHSSGHIYFTLKDENSKVSCFLPYDQRQYLRYQLCNGMEITASGYVYLFERGGSYSLNVREVTVSGTGNLQVAFEELKEKLQKEGLFDSEHKKRIPFYPKKVALITSPTGAAVQDIIKIIKGRNQNVDVLVYPCLVQGTEASADIARAISDVNLRFPEVDVMIVGRGGGSMEELWAFNEEIVARSIFLSQIPVISAIGHETDFTIADYVSDLRAETPTAAAQLAVPDLGMLKENLGVMGRELRVRLNRFLQFSELKVNRYSATQLYGQLKNRWERSAMEINHKEKELRFSMANRLLGMEQFLFLLKSQLERKNPQVILERGCAVLYDPMHKMIASVFDTKAGDRVEIQLKDGLLKCRVESIQAMNSLGGE